MSSHPSQNELNNLTDEQLIKRRDAMASNTVVGTAFYTEELARRQASAQNAKMLGATARIEKLTWFIAVLTIVNILLVVKTILT